MPSQPINRGGRPPFGSEVLSEQRILKLSPTMNQKLVERSQETGVSAAELIRRFVSSGLSAAPQKQFPSVPCLGLCCAGPGLPITHLPEGVTVTPPFPLPVDAYSLAVVGDSMFNPSGRRSILPGSIAFFRPDQFAPPGAVVHVEWEQGGTRYATIKRLVENERGERVLVPLNPAHDTLVPDNETWEIKGVFLRAMEAQQAPPTLITADETLSAVAGELERFGHKVDEPRDKKRRA